LYYFDGENTVAISDSFSNSLASTPSKALLVYSKYNKSEVPKTKLSEVSYAHEVRSLVTAAISSSKEIFIALKGSENALAQTNGINFDLNYSKNAVYFLDDYSYDKGYGVLMKASIKGDKLSPPTKVDEDVNFYEFKEGSDSIIYFKDVRNYAGDMYVDNQRIDSDVYVNGYVSFKNSSRVVYYVDYSQNNYTGTLRIYDGKKTNRIADDVANFVAIDDKNIAYLVDYNYDREKGDAYLYDGSSKPKLIDIDVTTFIPVFSANFWD